MVVPPVPMSVKRTRGSSYLASTWSLRRWRGRLFGVRHAFRAAAALISLGRWLHRLPA